LIGFTSNFKNLHKTITSGIRTCLDCSFIVGRDFGADGSTTDTDKNWVLWETLKIYNTRQLNYSFSKSML